MCGAVLAFEPRDYFRARDRLRKLLQRAMDADFDGAGFAAEEAGDFVVFHFLEAAEDEDFAFVFGELHERALEELRFLLALGGVVRAGWGKRFGGERRLGTHFADLIDAGVARDLVHPGAECGAGAIGLAITQDAEKNFLDEVFADGAVLRHF